MCKLTQNPPPEAYLQTDVGSGVSRNIVNDSSLEELIGDTLRLNVAKCNKNQQYGVMYRSVRCGATLLCPCLSPLAG